MTDVSEGDFQFALTPEDAKKRLKSTFSNGLMTMISVVLGVAVGLNINFLIYVVTIKEWILIVHFIFILLLISGMFHMYSYTTLFILSPPRIWNALELMAIGSLLCALPAVAKELCSQASFLVALGIFYVVCLAAFQATKGRSDNTDYSAWSSLDIKQLINRDACCNQAVFATATASLFAYAPLMAICPNIDDKCAAAIVLVANAIILMCGLYLNRTKLVQIFNQLGPSPPTITS